MSQCFVAQKLAMGTFVLFNFQAYMPRRLAFVLAPSPNIKKWTWAGDMMEPHLLGQLLSRATHRLYVCGQDLREGILLPSKGALKEEGLHCGVPRHKVQTDKTQIPQSTSKKQLNWARLVRHVDKVVAPNLNLKTINILS